MLEKQHLENIEKKVWDVNILAIYLVRDHPGNKYVTPIIESGLKGEYIPVLIDILPIRAYWIMEKKWKIEKGEAEASIRDFLEKYDNLLITKLTKETILNAFKLSKELRHDIYDTVYVSVAKSTNATTIITTDTDFKKLCKKTNLKYLNPIPPKILKKFKNYK